MKRRFLGLALVAVLSGLLLAGCAGSQPAGTEATSKVADTKPEAATSADTNLPAEEQLALEHCVDAQWAEDVLTNLSDYEQFILGMEEELPLVYFSTKQTVADFKVLSLNVASMDDDGNVRFSVEETYHHGTLTPEKPLLARMELMGTIPNNGISYVDVSGKTRYFAVDVSGYDGALLLTEFTP